jgi:cytochrome oxidase Cu insertion factor (SCO1/SenC/PrrC family)
VHRRIHRTIRGRLAAHELSETVVRKYLLPVILVAFAGGSFASTVQDVSPQRGHSVAPINWTDDAGRVRGLSEFAGFPVILLPIYTRCPTACIANVDQLKTALSGSSADPRQFRVLLFSFDASDTPAKLTAYRTREKIPLSWFVGTGTQQNIDTLLESIGFQYGRAGREFTHPNIVLFLDSKLRIAKWIYGTDYSGGDVDRALKVAGGGSDWIGQHSEWLYTLFLVASSILCVALVYYLAQLSVVRRRIRQTQVGCGQIAIELDHK